MTTLSGVITHWGARGFGFIQPHNGGREVYLHIKNIAGGGRATDFLSGARVEFELVKDEPRPRAHNVRVIGYDFDELARARNGAGSSK